LWSIFRDLFHYCAVQLETIADNARDLDLAVRWGFGWNQGPFEIWQAAGWKQIANWIQEDISAGKTMSQAPLPQWVMAIADSDTQSVHTAQGSFAPTSGKPQLRSNCRYINASCFRIA
jgi:3-hydroxyacyl-CoA dehydrogenase